MQHKFPFVSLRMEMEGNDLDVNVHPAKREVRFAREQEVYDAVYDTVRAALTRREMIPKVPVDNTPLKEKEEKVTRAAVPEPFEKKRRETLYEAQKPFVAREPAMPYRPAESTESVESAGKPDVIPHVKSVTDKPKAAAFSEDEEKMFRGTLRENQKLDEEKKLAEISKQEESEPVQEKVSEIKKELEPVQEKVSEIKKEPETLQEKASEIQEEPAPKQLELFEEKLLAPESRSRIQLIGQIFDTYWLVQFEDNFYIIDQHAAHEKVYYERMVKQFREHSIDSQYLNPPLIVTMSMQEEEILRANSKYFEQFGFEIENFGGREYRISAVPSNLYGLTEEELFLEMLDNLASNNSKDTLDIFAARLATMACKAAVKGNHAMSPAEAEKLIDELLTLENPYHCPHGRPTIIAMTRTELEKKFKRIV